MKDDISTPTNEGTGSILKADIRTSQARDKWLAGSKGMVCVFG